MSQSNTVLRFRATNRDQRGVAGAGRPGERAADLAKRLYDRRYRAAEIIGADGKVIGAVERRDGKRIWWGER